VSDNGTFSADKRKDVYWKLSAAWTRGLPAGSLWGKLESAAGLDGSYELLDSNQNSYDVTAAAFHRGFYSYADAGVGPRWEFRWRGWMTGGVSYRFVHRAYAHRPAQNADGSEKGGAIKSDTQTARLNLTFPIAAGFSATLRLASQHVDSNMSRETTYRYNYTSSNYFLGVTYEL
jgi:hypothetical protein